jgi:hypothetical protein
MIDFADIINAIKKKIGFDFNLDWHSEEKIEKYFEQKYGYLFKLKVDDYKYVDGEEGDTSYTEWVAFIDGKDVITYQHINMGGDRYETNLNMPVLLQQEPKMVLDLMQQMMACLEIENDIQFYPHKKISAIVVDGTLSYDYNKGVVNIETNEDLSNYGYFFLIGKAVVMTNEYKTETGYTIPINHNMPEKQVFQGYSSEDYFWGAQTRTIAMIKKEE